LIERGKRESRGKGLLTDDSTAALIAVGNSETERILAKSRRDQLR
jgi:hypothetical protein